MNLKHTIFIILALHLQLSIAQTVKTVQVYSEKDGQSNINCQFSHESGVAAVESALRYNRVNVYPKDKNGYGVLKFYFVVTNWETTSKSCSVGLTFHAHDYAEAKLPGGPKNFFAKTLFCEDGTTGYLDKSNMQSTINSALKEFTDKCISLIERNAK